MSVSQGKLVAHRVIVTKRRDIFMLQAALAGFFVLCLVFARAGGVGVINGPAPLQTAKNEPLHASISLRCALAMHMAV